MGKLTDGKTEKGGGGGGGRQTDRQTETNIPQGQRETKAQTFGTSSEVAAFLPAHTGLL